jgi:hypothetical protein
MAIDVREKTAKRGQWTQLEREERARKWMDRRKTQQDCEEDIRYGADRERDISISAKN